MSDASDFESELKSIDMRAHARAYARKGWSIFPVWWPSEPALCACPMGAKCNSPAKHPITKQGVKDATTNQAIIDSWWKKYPLANIGVACGKVSSIFVVDIDPRNGGDSSAAKLSLSKLTPMAITGGGGRHLFYKFIDGQKNAKNILPGIDIKTTGGYVLLAPSMHASGDRYKWAETQHIARCKLQPIDQCVIDAIDRQSKPQSNKAHGYSYNAPRSYGQDRPRPVKNFDREPAVINGTRNDTIFGWACHLRWTLRFSEGEIYDQIYALNQKKCNPPLPDSEIKTIVRSALRYT